MIASPPSCWLPIAIQPVNIPSPSIFNGETFPDFIDPPVQRVKSCVKTSVVKVKYISGCQKSENPVVSFHVDQYLLDRVTDKNNNVPQDVHRIFPLEKVIIQSWKIGIGGRDISDYLWCSGMGMK